MPLADAISLVGQLSKSGVGEFSKGYLAPERTATDDVSEYDLKPD